MAIPVYKRPHLNAFLLHKQQRQKNPNYPELETEIDFFDLLANWTFLFIFTFNSSLVTI